MNTIPTSIEVAREAIAAKMRQDNILHAVPIVLSGAWDGTSEVNSALLGAMLMHSKCYARVKQFEQTLELVISYDDLLRSFAGPAVIFEGDAKEIDDAYDALVKATRALLNGGSNEPE